MSDANIGMLMEMGFESGKAQEALRVCDGNVERAIEYLFGSGSGTSSASGSGTSSGSGGGLGEHEDVVASSSQYSLDNGRSACTCIALTAAQKFLQNPSAALLPQFLVDALQQGVSNYQQIQSAGGSSGTVEHMSAEEVLASAAAANPNPFGQLQLTPGGIRQGLLTNNPSKDNPMGLYTLLSACRQDAPPNAWLAVLLTKTPETVLAILPPTNNNNNQQFWVIDSHPRPTVGNGSGAYARKLASLDGVVAHLSAILPATELGPDIPEMMAMMYNSFDLYPLILKK